ncbi:MAG: hypothetical protein RIG68_15285 [Imperialibacter sp.]|uniref:hypothetical protein n=1 Tax=Imperialibacter sp. TaxID=2038411 RepID=UPI0032EFCFD6
MNKIPPDAYLIPAIFQFAIILTGWLEPRFITDWGVSVLSSVLAVRLVALVFYVIHVRRNENLNLQGKSQWILTLIITGLAGEIFYWFKHVRRPELA